MARKALAKNVCSLTSAVVVWHKKKKPHYHWRYDCTYKSWTLDDCLMMRIKHPTHNHGYHWECFNHTPCLGSKHFHVQYLPSRSTKKVLTLHFASSKFCFMLWAKIQLHMTYCETKSSAKYNLICCLELLIGFVMVWNSFIMYELGNSFEFKEKSFVLCGKYSCK